jgi:hypothetical protein
MKKLAVLIIAIIIGQTSFAQVMPPPDTSIKANTKMHIKADHIKMKDNKVWVIKNGEKTELTNSITLTDGTIVMKDGTVKAPDGTTTMMQNGDAIFMDGKWHKSKKDQ